MGLKYQKASKTYKDDTKEINAIVKGKYITRFTHNLETNRVADIYLYKKVYQACRGGKINKWIVRQLFGSRYQIMAHINLYNSKVRVYANESDIFDILEKISKWCDCDLIVIKDFQVIYAQTRDESDAELALHL